MVVIKSTGIAGEYELKKWSEMFREMAAGGVLVIPPGFTLEGVYDVTPEVKVEPADE